MAVGDQVVVWESNAANATTDIQPGSGAEWLVTTLMSQSAKSMEVYLTENGSTFTLLDTLTGGSVTGLQFRLTNTTWMRLKNIDGGAAYNGYMAVVTK